MRLQLPAGGDAGRPGGHRHRSRGALSGYGPRIEPLVGRLGDQLAEAGATELSAVLFTHLHQDHARGATWSGELTFPGGDRVRARRGGGVLVGTRAITAGRRAPAGGARSDQAVRRPAAPVRIRRRGPPPRPRRRRRGPHAGPHGVRAGEPLRAAALRGRHLLRQPAAQPPRDGGRPGITTRSDRSSAAAVSWAGPPTRTSSSTRTTCRFPGWAGSSGTAAPSGGSRPARAAPAEPVNGGWTGRRSRRGPGPGR